MGKKGQGRPAKQPDDKRKTVSIYLTPAELKEFTAHARALGVPLSLWFRLLARAAIDRRTPPAGTPVGGTPVTELLKGRKPR
jgi:hypothetical protein